MNETQTYTNILEVIYSVVCKLQKTLHKALKIKELDNVLIHFAICAKIFGVLLCVV